MASDGAEPYLKIVDVTKKFGDFTALQDISLDMFEKEFVCFLGPSGCGKTTLLRAIAGLDIQTAGQVFQKGRDISALPPSGRDFGIVFQSYALFPNLSVRDNVAYGLENQKVSKQKSSSASRNYSNWWDCPTRDGNTRRSFPAASSSVWPWPARWPRNRAFCCSMNRCPRSTPRFAPACAMKSRTYRPSWGLRPSWLRTIRKKR